MQLDPHESCSEGCRERCGPWLIQALLNEQQETPVESYLSGDGDL